jgi:hypothetical protein
MPTPLKKMRRPSQQFRQLGEVGRNPPTSSRALCEARCFDPDQCAIATRLLRALYQICLAAISIMTASTMIITAIWTQ